MHCIADYAAEAEELGLESPDAPVAVEAGGVAAVESLAGSALGAGGASVGAAGMMIMPRFEPSFRPIFCASLATGKSLRIEAGRAG